MRDYAKLQHFIKQIMSISPKYINIFGSNMPGVGGSAAVTTGASTPSADETLALRIALAEFVRIYNDPKSSHAQLREQANNVEAHLLAEETLSTLSDKDTERLINELYDLV